MSEPEVPSAGCRNSGAVPESDCPLDGLFAESAKLERAKTPESWSTGTGPRRTRKGGHPALPDDRPPVSGPGPVRARRLGTFRQVSRSAVLGFRGRGSRSELLRLVLYLRGDLLELRLELPAVVSTEQQLSATEQNDAQVRLGVAAVAAIGGRQRSCGGQNSSHVASSLARRAVVPGSTSNQAENVPALDASSKISLREGSYVAGWRRMSRITSVASSSCHLVAVVQLFVMRCSRDEGDVPGA